MQQERGQLYACLCGAESHFCARLECSPVWNGAGLGASSNRLFVRSRLRKLVPVHAQYALALRFQRHQVHGHAGARWLQLDLAGSTAEASSLPGPSLLTLMLRSGSDGSEKTDV